MTIEMNMKCIKGETWPIASFKSYVNTNSEIVSLESVIFHCPRGHKYTLDQALKKNLIPSDWVQKILSQAQKIKAKAEGPCEASDFTPDKKIASYNLPCIKCGGKAEFAIRQPKTKEEASKTCLCLKCRAAWHNYDAHFEIMTWGKASELFWMNIFERFIEGLPPLSLEASRDLLESFRKTVRSQGVKKKEIREE
ncbi:MAG: hypothetical protein WC302_00165 [Candidatus Paceibacterota bacterium]